MARLIMGFGLHQFLGIHLQLYESKRLGYHPEHMQLAGVTPGEFEELK